MTKTEKGLPCRCNQEANIKSLKTEFKTEIKYISKMIDEMHHVLIDNGTPGLLSQQNDLKVKVEKLKSELRTKDKQNKIFLSTIGGILAILQIIVLVGGI